MDLLVMGVIALLGAIIGALAGIIARKPKRHIATLGGVGLLVGIPVGYILAPFILSFY